MIKPVFKKMAALGLAGILAISPLLCQEANPAPEAASSQKVSLASPILVGLGAALMIAGGCIWINQSGDNQYWIPGISLFGTGLVSLGTGFILGGSEDLVQFNIKAAIEEGSKNPPKDTGNTEASPAPSSTPPASPAEASPKP